MLFRRALDIGSGSIKCEVAAVDAHGRLQIELFSAREQILFVEGIEITGKITSEARDRGAQAIQTILDNTQHLGVQQTIAVATEGKAGLGMTIEMLMPMLILILLLCCC